MSAAAMRIYALLGLSAVLSGQPGSQLNIGIHSEPKTLNPLLVSDEVSETVRYLTGGVLIRLNRYTQRYEPELAESWKVAADGAGITLTLRRGVKFSDGTPFTAEDVVHTFQTLLDPATRSPAADAFRTDGGAARATAKDARTVTIRFPGPVSGVERLFDQVAIVAARATKERASLGPFMLSEHKPGAYLHLARNPHYWKKDESGRRLPLLDAIRLEVQANREAELLRFQRGQLHLMNTVDPESFDRLKTQPALHLADLGMSLGAEFLWFNQAPKAPIAEHRKAWFASRGFRRAISHAIARQDLARVVFRGHATPAAGGVSPANQFWSNAKLKPHEHDLKSAQQLLAQEGFRLENGTLRDSKGNAVAFSLLTNAGNRARERMAAMIQEDLKRIGIGVNIVTLDFPSLLERISRTADYEACLLSFVNTDLDPNGQKNVLMSSGLQHAWNPAQAAAATAWEQEMDKLMLAQAGFVNDQKRKPLFDRVQELMWEQAPMLYLVHKNVLVGVAGSVQNAKPALLWPYTFWNAERLSLGESVAGTR